MKLKVLILLAGLFTATSLFAAPGDLDPTFNGGGKLLTGTNAMGLTPTNMMAVQEDGKIIAAV